MCDKNFDTFKVAMRELYELNVFSDLVHKFGVKILPKSQFIETLDSVYNKTIARVADSLGYKIKKIDVYYSSETDTRPIPAMLCWQRATDESLLISDDLFSKCFDKYFDMNADEREVFVKMLWKIFGESESKKIRAFLDTVSWG